MKKYLIWSSDTNLEDWRDFLEDYAGSEGKSLDEMSEYEKYDLIADYNNDCLDDERANLNIQLDGDILVIADIGRWNGRCQGYKFIKSGNISDILYGDCDDHEWYSDGYNIRCRAAHHDGVNYYLYREVKPGVNPEPLLNAIYDGKEITSAMLCRYTRSLHPYVAAVYGWPSRIKKCA